MRAIYALKTWMFGRHLKLSTQEDQSLFTLSVFVSRVYVQKWFSAPLAAQAPLCDLKFLQTLYKNRKNGSHWWAALQKFANHLWYLSPKLLCFALFDDGVSAEQKCAIVEAMQDDEDNEKPPVRAEVDLDDKILTLELQDFACKQSMEFFEVTGISSKFLQKHPTEWETDIDFQAGKRIVTHFKVVNDAAERAVALVTKFMKSNTLTNDEEQRQLLLVTVAEDRKKNKLK